jgi:tRNA dimethylallyltransferase
MDAIDELLRRGAKAQALMILGPTAGGKSALSLEIAKRHEVEIISMDSALVYRGMDIGTAKPTPEERAVCPHHLIDIRDIGEAYSAADFLQDAVRLVAEIRARGRLPLIVGGTMLYAKALREGINDMPSTAPEVRERVARQAAECGWPAMHEALEKIDPVTAARLAPNDSQRIGRALEVWHMTGRPISAFHAENVRRPAVETLTVGLLPTDRKWLHARIEARFDQMLADGFLDEVRCLMKRPDYDPESPAMRAVGYRQAIDFIEGRTDMAAFHLAGVAATRQLAKRQMTWMRGMKDVLLMDPEDPDAFNRVSALISGLR